jgi:hypothetical protein
MFRMIVYTHWKWSRMFLLPCAVIAFALPVLSVQWAGEGNIIIDVIVLVEQLSEHSIWYPLVAGAIGLIVALTAWREDHRGKHVYALSLPVPRWHYVLMRFAGGAVLVAVPVVALWLGALTATASVTIPEGLRAYPNALALRFALAAFVSYAAFFAISSGTERTAAYVLGGIGGFVALQLLLTSVGVDVNLLALLFRGMASAGGPLAIFTGRWMLIDV